MRITCPSCAAEYEVAASLLATPRTVRCARCGQDWTPPPAYDAAAEAAAWPVPAPPPPAPAPAAPEPAPLPAELPVATITAPPAPAIPVAIPPAPPTAPQGTPGDAAAPRRGRAGLAGTRAAALVPACWAASILLLAGMAWAGYEWRGEVVRAWPPSGRLYAMLGLPPAR